MADYRIYERSITIKGSSYIIAVASNSTIVNVAALERQHNNYHSRG
ncbi:MAG: hypothetical protein QXT67_06405 [Candidatus Bathyarchaeia archaeon]